MMKNVPSVSVMHKLNILHLFWGCDVVQQFWLLFQKSVNEKCTCVTNMTLNEDFVLFGHMKDFESDYVLDFTELFAKLFLYTGKMENKYPFSRICKTTSRF